MRVRFLPGLAGALVLAACASDRPINEMSMREMETYDGETITIARCMDRVLSPEMLFDYSASPAASRATLSTEPYRASNPGPPVRIEFRGQPDGGTLVTTYQGHGLLTTGLERQRMKAIRAAAELCEIDPRAS